MTRIRYRDPEMEYDLRVEAGREAIADARADARARELGFHDDDEYRAAMEDIETDRALHERAEARYVDEDAERYAAWLDEKDEQ